MWICAREKAITRGAPPGLSSFHRDVFLSRPLGPFVPNDPRYSIQSRMASLLDCLQRAVHVGCVPAGIQAGQRRSRRRPMSPGAVALTTMLAIVALGVTIGFLAGMRQK